MYSPAAPQGAEHTAIRKRDRNMEGARPGHSVAGPVSANVRNLRSFRQSASGVGPSTAADEPFIGAARCGGADLNQHTQRLSLGREEVASPFQHGHKS